jgi:hypothetical protein
MPLITSQRLLARAAMIALAVVVMASSAQARDQRNVAKTYDNDGRVIRVQAQERHVAKRFVKRAAKRTVRHVKKPIAQPQAQPDVRSPLEFVGLFGAAIYDIAAHVVYLPNGQRLEAHSGFGERRDDPRSVRVKNRGPTPPGVYRLTMRESRFHGVEAIRLNPVDISKMHGRDGILAHSYMAGPNGQSNGCLSLKDYAKFLAAFRRGEFNQIVVVERLDGRLLP